MTSKKHILKQRPLFYFCFIFSGVLIVFYFHFEAFSDTVMSQFLADDTADEFLVHTPGCKIPAWDPWDESVKKLFKPTGLYKCPGQPSFLRVLPRGVVAIEDAIVRYYYEVDLKNISCVYQKIQRNAKGTDVDKFVSLAEPKKLIFNRAMKVEFVKTTCKIRSRYFTEFLPLTPLKPEVELRNSERQEINKISNPINVIFLGLDSISHLNYIRHFPRCQSYLSKLSPITMRGYTKVGDNTFPNLVPLLTGHYYNHYYKRGNKTMFFDDLDFSWKLFSNLGYRTMLAEDAPKIATFNYYRNGFKKSPTDYYYRPFALALENSKLKANSKGQCFGNKMEMELTYEYLKNFLSTMGNDRPYFVFLFLARLTHDVFNFAGFADEPTFKLIKHLNENGHLNNTMLVFFSDHGIRFGEVRNTRIGQYEERMPLMQLILPDWFLQEHRSMHSNLIANTRRLTSPFDIHSTMVHLASLVSGKPLPDTGNKFGHSLFDEISENRTCADAGISPHWCTCQISKPISVSDKTVQTAAQSVIDTMNLWLIEHNDKCSILTLDVILNARVTKGLQAPKNKSRKGIPKFTPEIQMDFLIVISVLPSEGIFEATVRCNSTQIVKCEVLDEISRVNKYGKQSDCIDDTVLQKFCFCN